jgi:ankyrin repeat protein
MLPAQPHIDHLRHEAKELLRAARTGDTAAVARMSAVSDRQTLAAAQLAVARDYGFASWAKLKTEVQARTEDLARLADEFCVASIRDWTGRAVRMLEARPELAGYNLATAVVLGDADKFRRAIEADPGLATAPDPRTGWTALHAAAASKWNKLDPGRQDGLAAIARLALDAGADPNGTLAAPARAGSRPLWCAVAGEANPPIARMLLERGAVPFDDDLYIAGFADDDHECLRMLLDHSADVRAIARMALAAPISLNDADGIQMLLEAGADPRQYRDDNGEPFPVVYAAVRSDCLAEIVDMLLAHGAQADEAGPDGRSPYALAVSNGRGDLADVLLAHGARPDASDIDVFMLACLNGDHAGVERQLAAQPDLLASMTSEQRGAVMVRAAETGNTEALRIMLDHGFHVGLHGGDDGATALHAAAYSGSASAARLLIDRGADIEAPDGRWESPPIVWAIIGSSEKHTPNPSPDWPATVGMLLEAGASVEGITISPDDDHPPSPAVAQLLRQYGVRDEQ